MRHRLAPFVLLSLLPMASAVAQLLENGPLQPVPAVTGSFDASAVPAYRGDHARIHADIDANQPAHIAHLQRWVRQRSISAQDDGVVSMAELLRDDLKALGFKEAELVPTKGHPGVWGWYDAGKPVTLAVYMMYDVQPIEAEGWTVDPFAGELVDDPQLGKVLMARGATNQKGPQRAFLNALESIRRVAGELPVNLMVVAEGEEELGSPNYPQVIDRYEARLKTADGVFFPYNSQSPDGDVTMFLGVKGILYMELEAKGGPHGGPQKAEIHGSYKAVVDAPAWRLVQALASLTTPDGNGIAVPGYFDRIRVPNEEELRLVNAMLAEGGTDDERERLGVARWIDGIEGRDALLRELFTTTLNIDGIVGGYTGVGVKTILPHRALAKVDSRLVPDQTPDEAIRLIREHLKAGGFDDIEVRQMSGYPPAQTSVDTALARAVIGVYNKYGHTPKIAPRLAGSAPYYVFTQRLGLPLIAGGMGYGSGAHAPNEFMLIAPNAQTKAAGLAEIEKSYVDLLYALDESVRAKTSGN